MTRKERKPLRKRAQRNRTRLLHVRLDELVPVYSEPEGGKLRSGRTVTQLLQDLVTYTKAIVSPVREERKMHRTTTGTEVFGDDLIRGGMMSCRTERILVFDRTTLRVEDASNGMLRFLDLLPFKGPIGQSLLNILHPLEHGRVYSLLRMLDHQDGQLWIDTEVMSFPRAGGFCGQRCSLLCTAADGNRGFIFIAPDYPACSPGSPVPGAGRRCRNFVGNFQYEEICSSSCPLELCEQLSCSLGPASVGWYGKIAHTLGVHDKSDLVDRLTQEIKIIRRKGVFLRMIQLHCRLPFIFGAHATEWERVLDLNLSNNFSMTADQSPGFFTAWKLDLDSCGDQVRLLEIKLKQSGDRFECLHSRFLHLSPEELHYSGYIPPPLETSQQELNFHQVFRKISHSPE